jgi:[ribosomal protein S5]-alanine N-acetyltransferase
MQSHREGKDMEIGCGICKVRSWRLQDIESLVRHANNHRVWRNLRDRFPHPYTRADAERWVGFAVAADPEVDFAIEFNGELVGGIGLTLGAGEDRHSAELGYWLGEEAWGKGVATAAVRCFAAFAGSTFGLWRIFAVPFSDNAASVRVLEKAGFEREGFMRCSAVKEGRIKDQYLYALLLGFCRDHLEGR